MNTVSDRFKDKAIVRTVVFADDVEPEVMPKPRRVCVSKFEDSAWKTRRAKSDEVVAKDNHDFFMWQLMETGDFTVVDDDPRLIRDAVRRLRDGDESVVPELSDFQEDILEEISELAMDVGGDATGYADVVFVSKRVWDEIESIINKYSYSGGTFSNFNVVLVSEWIGGEPCDVRAYKNTGHHRYVETEEEVESMEGDNTDMKAYEMTVTADENAHTLETKLDDSLFEQ